MKKCLVLAFSTLKDLPKSWQKMTHIDAYGQIKNPEHDVPTNLHIHDRFFEIGKVAIPTIPYQTCFIRHPDPWGEPRSWIQAIAALGESLQGTLQCEFWFPHEIIAFHFLLNRVLDSSHVEFECAQEIAPVNQWENYTASWFINRTGVCKEMDSSYKQRKQNLLEEFYHSINQYYHPTELAKIIDQIRSGQF